MRESIEEERLRYIGRLEHDNAVLEARADRRLQRIRTLRDANIELQKKADECQKLWRIRV